MARNRGFNRLMWLGILFFAIGNVSVTLLSRLAVIPELWNDAVRGLFYGLAIGCMTLGLKRNAGSRCNSHVPPSA